MKEVKFIDPKSDYGFKVLFGTVANKELTIGFLNSLLDKQIKDITFQNVEMLGEDTPYKRFLYILNHVEIMGEIPKHIWENDNFLKKLKSAVEVERMSLDERLAYELSLSVERDWYACMEYRYEEGVEKGKQEGLIKGKQEGKLEGLYQTATNLKKSGIDLQTIADCTGLTLEEVEKL